MFDWFFSLFSPPTPKFRRRAISNVCRVCGHRYDNPDSAAICGDWDTVVRWR